MKYKNKVWLYHQYWDLGKSTHIIAREYNMNSGTVFYWMKKFKIPTRSRPISNVNLNMKEDPSYVAIHTWVRLRKKIPKVCEICKKPGKLELSNKTGKLIRDIDNFQYVHCSCHRHYDMDNNIIHYKEVLRKRNERRL